MIIPFCLRRAKKTPCNLYNYKRSDDLARHSTREARVCIFLEATPTQPLGRSHLLLFWKKANRVCAHEDLCETRGGPWGIALGKGTSVRSPSFLELETDMLD